jgi:hypothetical protein
MTGTIFCTAKETTIEIIPSFLIQLNYDWLKRNKTFNNLRIQEQCRWRVEQQCKGLGYHAKHVCTQSQAPNLTQRKSQCPLDSIHPKKLTRKTTTTILYTVKLPLLL